MVSRVGDISIKLVYLNIGSYSHTHTHTHTYIYTYMATQMALVEQNSPDNAGDIKAEGSITGSEDPLEEGKATHTIILAWRIL